MAKIRKVPSKYLTRISSSTQKKRSAAIRKKMLGKVPKSEIYKPLPGDSKKPTRKSQYTYSLKDLRKEISATRKEIRTDSKKTSFIRATAMETGIPAPIIRQVYERGQAAWGTGGHRVGASQESWAIARVYSFLQKGKTATTADQDLYKLAKKKQKGEKYKLK
jgi:hypothetical protein